MLAAAIGAIAWIRREPRLPPPPAQWLAGVPVSGDLATARRAGFVDCFNIDAVHVRCRRHGIMLYGNGPYEAAVDLRGSEGQSGFDHVTLWHDGDQAALYHVLASLDQLGWSSCHTEIGHSGGEAIFAKPYAAVFASIDISYYGKRRLRLFPTWHQIRLAGPCFPDHGLELFEQGS